MRDLHSTEVPEAWDAARVLDGPSHHPFGTTTSGPLFQHPLFLEARCRHERMEGPHHVQQQGFLRNPDDNNFVALDAPENEAESINFLEEIHFDDYAFAVTLPTPASEAEWRAIVRDPSKFIA